MIEDLFPKLKKIPAPLYAFFMTDAPRILCEEAVMRYRLSEDSIPAVTGPTAELFLKEVPLSDYPKLIAEEAKVAEGVAYGVAYEVNQRIFLRFPEYFTDAERLGREWEAKKSAPVISLEEAKKKVFELEPWLLEPDEEEEAKEEQALIAVLREKLPLLSAIGKYPRLGEQIITRDRIMVRNQVEPVRPNLTNWLRVYRDELGVGYHDPMIRGKFIFDSVNCKKLSSEERERLNLVLRSIEENMPIDIDPTKMEIVFPEFRASEKNHPVSAPVSGMARLIQRPSAPNPATGPARPVAPSTVSNNTDVRNERPQPRPFVPNPPVLQPTTPPRAPARKPVSFVPSPPPDLPVGGTFSFSSPHALPVESTGEGELSIRIPGSPSLPSGQAAFGVVHSASDSPVSTRKVVSDRSGSETPAIVQLAPQSAPDLNPFHIHPVGGLGRGRTSEPEAGSTIDLRNDG
ncbi:MAG: hypothetical protein HGB34_02115 [Candidatus Moranbacteria bacterium]|nr:hypothetical protein [Candidatus Moranbacteria bacterium]